MLVRKHRHKRFVALGQQAPLSAVQGRPPHRQYLYNRPVVGLLACGWMCSTFNKLCLCVGVRSFGSLEGRLGFCRVG